MTKHLLPLKIAQFLKQDPTALEKRCCAWWKTCRGVYRPSHCHHHPQKQAAGRWFCPWTARISEIGLFCSQRCPFTSCSDPKPSGMPEPPLGHTSNIREGQGEMQVRTCLPQLQPLQTLHLGVGRCSLPAALAALADGSSNFKIHSQCFFLIAP